MFEHRIKHEIVNGHIQPVVEREPTQRLLYTMDEEYYRTFPGAYKDYAEPYLPLSFYHYWRDSSRKEEAVAPHYEFSRIDEEDEEAMRIFCSRWGSLSRQERVSVDDFKQVLRLFKNMLRIKEALDRSEFYEDDVILFDVQMNEILKQVTTKTEHCRHLNDDGTYYLQRKVSCEFPSLLVTLFYMLHLDMLGGLNTRFCSDEDGNGCGLPFSTTLKVTRYCSVKCKERAKSARYYKRNKEAK